MVSPPRRAARAGDRVGGGRRAGRAGRTRSAGRRRRRGRTRPASSRWRTSWITWKALPSARSRSLAASREVSSPRSPAPAVSTASTSATDRPLRRIGSTPRSLDREPVLQRAHGQVVDLEVGVGRQDEHPHRHRRLDAGGAAAPACRRSPTGGRRGSAPSARPGRRRPATRRPRRRPGAARGRRRSTDGRGRHAELLGELGHDADELGRRTARAGRRAGPTARWRRSGGWPRRRAGTARRRARCTGRRGRGRPRSRWCVRANSASEAGLADAVGARHEHRRRLRGAGLEPRVAEGVALDAATGELVGLGQGGDVGEGHGGGVARLPPQHLEGAQRLGQALELDLAEARGTSPCCASRRGASRARRPGSDRRRPRRTGGTPRPPACRRRRRTRCGPRRR